MSDRQTLIDAIVGRGVPFTWGAANDPLVEFCGNQHNEDWRWNMPALKALSTDDLSQLYKEVKRSKRSGKVHVTQ